MQSRPASIDAPPAAALSRRAYEAILERIFRRELHPGEFLDRRTVARELGMSPAPVLEAMVQLQSEGLLEVLPRRGTRIRILTSPYLQGQLLVREALECEAARLICGQRVRENFRALLPLARALDRSSTESPAAWRAEVEFHLALVRLTGNVEFLRQYERIMRVGLFLRINQAVATVTTTVESSHVELLQGLCAKDPDVAERIMRKHSRSGKDTLLELG